MDTLPKLTYATDSSSVSEYSSTPPLISNYSRVPSPASALQEEFLTLNVLPRIYDGEFPLAYNNDLHNNSVTNDFTDVLHMKSMSNHISDKYEKDYPAVLKIIEEPIEKFRFRYKSEMHGTHGSLNGGSSQRNQKTFPEVQLCNYNKSAIIRCSLFQINMHSPHSHQLVIRKDDVDIVDPHDVRVSPSEGYYAKFGNMGIIQTAKKYIVKELLEKKHRRLIFELGRNLTTKEEQEILKQSEKEAKDMNLNQVRLCFEAFKLDSSGVPVLIANPVYSRIINNRKSAQTGELRITRLSVCTGSVSGGEDLILLVEKVSKKNIKVRFYEMFDDDIVWEAFAHFRESDVHHQYAIVCKTPPYKDRDIDHAVEVSIELMRPSDDERSYPPVTFRYKPRETIVSRKRRRISSTATANSSGSTLNSDELPKTVQEQCRQMNSAEIMEELDRLLKDSNTKQKLSNFSDENTLDDFLEVLNNNTFLIDDILHDRIEKDGISETKINKKHFKKVLLEKDSSDKHQILSSSLPTIISIGWYLQRILKIFLDVYSGKLPANDTVITSAAEQINIIFNEHLDNSSTGDSIIHDIVINDNIKMAVYICRLLHFFQLKDLLNNLLNNNKQTVLHCACLYDRPQYIRPFLNLGCKSNIQDKEGNTAMHIAVIEGHLTCLNHLINFDKTIELNILNDDGFTPLHLAIRNNNDVMAKKLLQYDKTIAAIANGKDGSNALHLAIKQQSLPIIKLILQTQNIERILQAINAAGYTPLALAKQLYTNSEFGFLLHNTLEEYFRKHNVKHSTLQLANEIENYDPNLLIKQEKYIPYSCSVSSCKLYNKTDGAENNGKNSTRKITTTEVKCEYIIDKNKWKKALLDPVCYCKICEALNENEKWKLIAMKMDIDYFYMNNAEAFLNMTQRNINDINYNVLNEAINEVDSQIQQIIEKYEELSG